MRHRKRKITLSRTAARRRELVRTLAVALVTHGALRTTPAKAKVLRRFVEPLVTTAKANNLSARRAIIAALGNRSAAGALLKLAERFRDRPGGYTRITRLPGVRSGDSAAQVRVEFV